MAFLRAFVDDSAAQTGDKRLFYAGYLHRADAWAEFSEVWDWELHQWPAIEYFKGSGDQFNGWDADLRDAKIAKLAEIIWWFEPISFHFSLNRRLFEEALKPIAPYGFGRPHYHACFAVMAGVARQAVAMGITTPIEFIFDKQDGVDDDVRFFFQDMIKALPPNVRELISDYAVYIPIGIESSANLENDAGGSYAATSAFTRAILASCLPIARSAVSTS